MSQHQDRFIAPITEFPTTNPVYFPSDANEETFCPNTHLALSDPEFVIDTNFEKRTLVNGRPSGENFPGLLYTAPFRVLSDAGVEKVRAIIEKHKSNPHANQSDERTPLCLRGLGYLSPWICAFNRSSLLDEKFSGYAGDPICAHDMLLNYSQINIGQIGVDKPVDAWHFDSVDYVLVVVLSDLENMVGGNLEVLVKNKADAKKYLSSLNAGEPLSPHDQILKVVYPGAGYGILMQGSMMAHRVSPVLKAKEPRLSLVNSYMTRNVRKPDITVYQTFTDYDPMHITYAEYIRHKCARVKALLNSQLCADEPYDDPELMAKNALQCSSHLKKDQLRLPAVLTSAKAKEAIEVFNQAISELTQAKALLEGNTSDKIGYYTEAKKTEHEPMS